MVAVVMLAAACGSDGARECSANKPCATQGGVPGVCVPSTASDRAWCAYEDSSCAGGLRWGVLAGDGLDGTCVGGGVADGSPADAALVTLTVTKTGKGAGTVLSEPLGISCGGTCSAEFPAGTVVTLSGEASAGSSFVGWGAACQGVAGCEVTLNADTEVRATFSPPGEVLWAIRIGSTLPELLPRVLAAGDSVYVTGSYAATMTVGTEVLSPKGDFDVFIAKLRAEDGHVVWAKSFGGMERDSVTGLALLPDGSVVAALQFEKTIDVGTGPITSLGSQDALIVRVKPDGSPSWSARIGGPLLDSVGGITVDKNGDVFTTGGFRDKVNFGVATLTAPAMGQSAFLAKHDGDTGGVLWVEDFPSPTRAIGSAVVTNLNGDPIMIGGFSDSVDTDVGLPLMGPENSLFIVQRGGVTGSEFASDEQRGTAELFATGAAVDALGHVVFVGTFQGEFSVRGNQSFVSAGLNDIFVSGYRTADSSEFTRTYGSTGLDFAWSVDCMPPTDLVIGGGFEGSVTFGGATLSGVGSDAYVVRTSRGGQPIWARSFGGTQSDATTGVSVGTGRIFATSACRVTAPRTSSSSRSRRRARSGAGGGALSNPRAWRRVRGCRSRPRPRVSRRCRRARARVPSERTCHRGPGSQRRHRRTCRSE
jgi:hypothetical protein